MMKLADNKGRDRSDVWVFHVVYSVEGESKLEAFIPGLDSNHVRSMVRKANKKKHVEFISVTKVGGWNHQWVN